MPVDDSHEVRITLGDIYAVQQTQTQLLTQMGSDLKRALDALDRTKQQVSDHEDRIRVLERKVWQASGIASFVGAAAGVLINLLYK